MCSKIVGLYCFYNCKIPWKLVCFHLLFRQFGIYRIPHAFICCLLFVSAYLYLTNSVAVQSSLRAHAYRTSHNSSVRLHRIVYTLHVVIHQWVWIYYSVPIDLKLILMVCFMVHLITLFIRITIVPQPTFNYVRLVSCMNSLALETADNRNLVTSLSPKRNWRIS